MWNTLPLKINPIFAHFGGLDLRWYSLGYLFAILTLFSLVKFRLKRKELPYFSQQSNLEDRLLKIFAFAFLGMFLGAKLGYLIFYDWSSFLSSPWQTISPFSSGQFVGFFGLSFHGGLIGAGLFTYWAARKEKLDFFQLAELVLPTFPLAYFWGRLGNFFNGELFGRPTDQPWGMYFPTDPAVLRHPSQLYEALGEGILLFLFFWIFRQRQRKPGQTIFLYLIAYGLVRFFLEFFRQEPLFLLNLLTKGQILCLIMVFIGWLGFNFKKVIFSK